MKRTPLLCVVIGSAVILGPAGELTARGGDGRPKPIPLAAARLIIEYNASGPDVGLQAFVDGEPWTRLQIRAPNGRKLFDVRGRGNVGMLGLTELFFESHEPATDELSLEEFLALFPEGRYTFLAFTPDLRLQWGIATFTHAIPDAPVITSPLEGSQQDPNHTVISWEPVADPPGSQIVEYQVIVEQVDVEPKRVFSVHVPASVNSVTVPPEFLEPGVEYPFEVLAIEAGRNQTITESSFSTQ
ncbi:MAG: fibronectin type III domain-containing protein [Vicinamibacteraceae bacterium]